ncbi:MAG: AbrB/MazE/SpoVT family DNA-binding domain-containing protein [Candidatus Asgardarchaeia archaeon]
MEYAKIDKKGRLLIRKEIRNKVGIRKNSIVKIKVDERRLIIEPSEKENVAEEYYGIIKVDKWPEDIEKFAIEVVRKWNLEEERKKGTLM